MRDVIVLKRCYALSSEPPGFPWCRRSECRRDRGVRAFRGSFPRRRPRWHPNRRQRIVHGLLGERFERLPIQLEKLEPVVHLQADEAVQLRPYGDRDRHRIGGTDQLAFLRRHHEIHLATEGAFPGGVDVRVRGGLVAELVTEHHFVVRRVGESEAQVLPAAFLAAGIVPAGSAQTLSRQRIGTALVDDSGA